MLGIDPGLSMTGYAAASVDPERALIIHVLEVGVSATERRNLKQVRKGSEHLRRGREQAVVLNAIIDRYCPAAVAVELTTTTKHKHPIFSFGVMTGIVACMDPPVVEVLPHEVKLAATGNKRATKADVIQWALNQPGSTSVEWPVSARRNSLNLQHEGLHLMRIAEHPADALAAIQAALLTEQVRLAYLMSTRTLRAP